MARAGRIARAELTALTTAYGKEIGTVASGHLGSLKALELLIRVRVVGRFGVLSGNAGPVGPPYSCSSAMR